MDDYRILTAPDGQGVGGLMTLPDGRRRLSVRTTPVLDAAPDCVLNAVIAPADGHGIAGLLRHVIAKCRPDARQLAVTGFQ